MLLQLKQALVEAAAFTQASHVFWGIWAILQVRIPLHAGHGLPHLRSHVLSAFVPSAVPCP